MGSFLLGAGALVAALVMVFRVAQRTASTPEVMHRLDVLHTQVVAWQAAHDHQVAEVDRRMQRVEEAAARAETEARMVAQLVTGREAS